MAEKQPTPGRDLLLSQFWKLSNASDEVRLNASTRIVEILFQRQAAFEDGSKDALWCPDVKYSLERLIHGLASDRKASRLGFSCVFTQVLAKLDLHQDGEIKKILDLIEEKLKLSREKTEERGTLLGRVFALLAVVHACKLEEAVKSVCTIYRELINFAGQKSYLKSICYHGISELIKKVPNALFDQVLWESISGLLEKGWEECDADLFQILQTCCEHQPKTCGKTFLKANNWIGQKTKKVELIGPHSYKYLGKMLASTTTSHPRIHPLCYEVIENVVKSDKDSFRKFWKEAIDSGLLESTAERKYLALKLATHVLPLVAEEQVSTVWSNRLVRCVFYALSNKGNFLHQVCKTEFINKLSVQMKDANMTWKKQFTILFQLLSSPAGLFLDENTETRTIQSVVGSFHLDTVEKYVEWLKKLFLTGKLNHEGLKDVNLDTARRWSATQLSHLIRNPRIPKQDGWVFDVMKFLFVQYHFIATNAHNSKIAEVKDLGESFVPLTDKVRQHMKHCLEPALHAMYNLPSGSNQGSPSAKFHGTCSDGEFWIYKLIKFAEALLDDPCMEPFSNMEPQSRDALGIMVEKIEHIKEVEMKDKSRMFEGTAMRLLLSHVGIRLLNGSEAEIKDAQEVLSDLFEVADHRFGEELDGGKASGQVNWVEVVIETILSMLSQNSHSIRFVADQVFRLLSPQLTRKGLRLILDVLDPARRKEILKTDDGLGEDEEMDDEETADADGDDEDDEDSDSDSAFDDEDVSDEKDEEFREKVKEALGDAAESSEDEDNVENEKDEEKSDSDVEMDDDAMMRVDSMLAEVFRQKKMSKQKSEQDSRKQLLVFQLRCLDLIEIMAKRHLRDGENADADSLILEAVRPLLVTIQHASKNTTDMTLAEKASVLLRVKICKMKKYPKNLQPETISRCHDDIEVMMSIAKKAHSVFMCQLASDCCLFLIRVLCGNTTKDGDESDHVGVLDVPKIQKIYKEALEDFMTRRESRLQPCVMHDLMQRFPVLAADLASDLLKYVKDGVQVYRKSRACGMLHDLLKTPAGQNKCKVLLFQVVSIINEIIDRCVSNPEEIKTKYCVELLKLYGQALRCLKQTNQFESLNRSVLCASLNKFAELTDVRKSQELNNRSRGLLFNLGEIKPGQNPKNKKAKKRKGKTEGENSVGEKQNIENEPPGAERSESKKELKARVLKEKRERRKAKKGKRNSAQNEGDEGDSNEKPESLPEVSSPKKKSKKKKKQAVESEA